MSISELKLHHQFEHPRIESCRDSAERRVPEAGVWIAERRRVRDVERLDPKFTADALRDRERLAQHQVDCFVSGTDDGIPGTVADCELRRLGEGGYVEPSAGTSLIRLQAWIGDSIRALDSKPRE